MFVERTRCIGKLCWFALLMVAIIFGSRPTAAQCQRQHIQGPIAEFGGPTAMSGDYAAVYASSPDGARVQMLRRDPATNAWEHKQFVVPPVIQPGDLFGQSLSLSNDVLVVGAKFGGRSHEGTAYVYRRDPARDNWNHEATLVASDASEDAEFGHDVDVDADTDTIIVGAPGRRAAYVFQRDEWSLWTEQAVFDGAAEGWSQFAGRVQVSNGRAAVNSMRPLPDQPEHVDERVLLFRRDNALERWVEDGSVTSPHLVVNFCATFALDGDTLAVGSHEGGFTAVIHIFRHNAETQQWEHEWTLPGSGQHLPAISNRRWIALQGDDVMFNEVVTGFRSLIFVAKRDEKTGEWSRTLAIQYPHGVPVTWWPSVHAERAIVSQSGHAHLFDLTMPDCNRNLWCDDLDIANGISLDRNANGIPDECEGISGDVTHDGQVGADDFVAVILSRGVCPPLPAPCPGDANHSDIVDVDDLVLVILNWTG
jgi:hypothetical protein